MEWHALPATAVLDQLAVGPEGLSTAEVAVRSARYGHNVLPTSPPTPRWRLLVRQLKSGLVYLLIAAAAISFALGEQIDGWVILAAVILNMLVGYFQESRAEDALAKLREIVTFETVVQRDGHRTVIDASEVVPGDVLIITAGARIPADARLLVTIDLTVNEAALTGESEPVAKSTDPVTEDVTAADRSNIVHMGTVVQEGSGTGIVVATGTNTELGSIAELVSSAEETLTPLQQRLSEFSRTLTTAVLWIAGGLFVAGLAVGLEVAEIFTIAVAVAVAAVPEGLLVAVTAILAVGMNRIARRNALTRQLLAAETLGSTTVICADKTGTLTAGKMTVVSIITADGGFPIDDPRAVDLLRIGMLNNDAVVEFDTATSNRVFTGSPTETALLAAAESAGLDRTRLDHTFPRLDTEPFSSARKMMRTLHHSADGRHLLLVKGSPENLLRLSSHYRTAYGTVPLDEAAVETLQQAIAEATAQRLRLLAIGERRTDASDLSQSPEDGLELLGFVAMRDPLRPTAAHTVEICRAAGIRPVMITGDHVETAGAIARDLGLPQGERTTLTGVDLEAMTDDELAERVEDVSVYARVTPEHKMRIVRALAELGHVVAMTGDGVNDAPALKLADVGVALGSGTDVAKEAADIVILDDDFSTIVAAVEEGRVIYDNIRKVVLYLLSDSLSEVLLIAAAIVATAFVSDFPLPILAAQILWVNLVNDGPPYIALTVEPREPGIMDRPPPKPEEALLLREMRWLIVVVSVSSAALSFVIFTSYWVSTDNIDLARTMVFTALGMDSLFYLPSLRNLRRPVWRTNVTANVWLVWGIGAGLVLQIAAIYLPALQTVLGTVPLDVGDWLIVVAHVVVVIAAAEVTKHVLAQRGRVRS